VVLHLSSISQLCGSSGGGGGGTFRRDRDSERCGGTETPKERKRGERGEGRVREREHHRT